MGTVIGFILLMALAYLVSFGVTAGIIWLICWAFSIAFIGWKWCFGIWLILTLISRAVKTTVTKN